MTLKAWKYLFFSVMLYLGIMLTAALVDASHDHSEVVAVASNGKTKVYWLCHTNRMEWKYSEAKGFIHISTPNSRRHFK